ncbi:MAG: type II secretion system protein [Deltaproteobacteria bacterium]|nr:type II secretion system protein [Deltaproteobacteria bacterium]
MSAIAKENAFSYIAALIFVTVIGISLTSGSAYWSTIIKREKEKELLFRGDQIRRAIESYYNGVPGGGGSQYPASLNDLLKDPRYLTTQRHLRKIYKDPMTKDGEWGLITVQGGRIKGVFSKGVGTPVKTGNFPDEYEDFEKAVKYSDWKFVYPSEKEKTTSSMKEKNVSSGSGKSNEGESMP